MKLRRCHWFAVAVALWVVPSVAQVRRFDLFRASGGRVAWDMARNVIAFDARAAGGRFEVFVAGHCVTCGLPLPAGHRGGPAWIPGGGWLLFQAAPVVRYYAAPGIGLDNGIFALEIATGRVVQVYQPAPGRRVTGIHVSADGRRVCWTESGAARCATFQTPFKDVATISMPAALVLTAIEDFLPGGEVLMSASRAGEDPRATGLYACRAECRLILGDPHQRFDFARLTPSGKQILYASTEGGWFAPDPNDFKSDFWLLDLATGHTQRMTWFNEPANPHYIDSADNHGARVTASAWGPDGKTLVACVVTDARHLEERLIKIEFPNTE